MEAALRSVYEIYTGQTLENVNFENVRGMDGVRRAVINLNGFELKVGIAHGLGNSRRLLLLKLWLVPVDVSVEEDNHFIMDRLIFYTHALKLYTKKMQISPYANHMRIPIFKNCMKNI